MMYAAQEGHVEVVMKLAELGVDLATTSEVSTVLCIYRELGSNCGWLHLFAFARSVVRL